MLDAIWPALESLFYCPNAECGLKWIGFLLMIWVFERRGRRVKLKLGGDEFDTFGGVPPKCVKHLIGLIQQRTEAPQSPSKPEQCSKKRSATNKEQETNGGVPARDSSAQAASGSARTKSLAGIFIGRVPRRARHLVDLFVARKRAHYFKNRDDAT